MPLDFNIYRVGDGPKETMPGSNAKLWVSVRLYVKTLLKIPDICGIVSKKTKIRGSVVNERNFTERTF